MYTGIVRSHQRVFCGLILTVGLLKAFSKLVEVLLKSMADINQKS